MLPKKPYLPSTGVGLQRARGSRDMLSQLSVHVGTQDEETTMKVRVPDNQNAPSRLQAEFQQIVHVGALVQRPSLAR